MCAGTSYSRRRYNRPTRAHFTQACRGYEISHPYPYPYPQIFRGYPWIYPYPQTPLLRTCSLQIFAKYSGTIGITPLPLKKHDADIGADVSRQKIVAILLPFGKKILNLQMDTPFNA